MLDVIRRNKLPDTAWELLGSTLGLYRATLRIIRGINTNKDKPVGACMDECMAAWLEGRDNVIKSGLPSWFILVKCVATIDEVIAANIKAGESIV